jgi:hypothetical protein
VLTLSSFGGLKGPLRLKVLGPLIQECPGQKGLNPKPSLLKIFTIIHGRYPPGIMIKKLKKVNWAFQKVNCPSFQNTH